MRKESDITRFICTICRESKQSVAIGQCNHTRICSYCCMKSRMFYDDNKCPICNTVLLTLFVIPIQERTSVSFDNLETQKECFYKDDDFELTGIYFQEASAMEEALKLKGNLCPVEVCISEPFENLNELKQHLKLQHRKAYCDICIKDGKKFLSEQPIYTHDALKLHNEYGEYVNGYFISPPHPQCPFCKDMQYDDEYLYRHINQYHFICEICRRGKKVICYSALPNLIDHYKIKHYCCSYKDCVDDLYVVFEKESELINHFLIKHNMTQGSEKLHKMVYENKPSIISNPEDWNIALSRDEFNFTLFVEKLKAKAIQHSQMKQSTITYKEVGFSSVEVQEDRFNQEGNWKGKKGKHKQKANKIISSHSNENEIEVQLLPEKEEPKKSIQVPDSFDYQFILQFYIRIIKEHLIAKIKAEKLYESEFILEREIIYQLIVIIDKFDSNEKILQLTYLHNFGIELEMTKQLSGLLLQGENINEEEVTLLLNQMSLKKILILYKYLGIAYKKTSKMFFKLELEQIEEDLYDEFIPRKHKAPSHSHKNISNNINNNISLPMNGKKKHNKKNKWNWDQQPVPGLIEPKKDKDKDKGKLNYLFGKNTASSHPEEKKASTHAIPQEKSQMKSTSVSTAIDDPLPSEPKKKSKLAMLLDSNIKGQEQPNKKKGNVNVIRGANFKLSNFDLDEDFPVLK